MIDGNGIALEAHKGSGLSVWLFGFLLRLLSKLDGNHDEEFALSRPTSSTREIRAYSDRYVCTHTVSLDIGYSRQEQTTKKRSINNKRN